MYIQSKLLLSASKGQNLGHWVENSKITVGTVATWAGFFLSDINVNQALDFFTLDLILLV